jgi:hypothetical protein
MATRDRIARSRREELTNAVLEHRVARTCDAHRSRTRGLSRRTRAHKFRSQRCRSRILECSPNRSTHLRCNPRCLRTDDIFRRAQVGQRSAGSLTGSPCRRRIPRKQGMFSGRTRFPGRKLAARVRNQRWLHTAGRLSWAFTCVDASPRSATARGDAAPGSVETASIHAGTWMTVFVGCTRVVRAAVLIDDRA